MIERTPESIVARYRDQPGGPPARGQNLEYDEALLEVEANAAELESRATTPGDEPICGDEPPEIPDDALAIGRDTGVEQPAEPVPAGKQAHERQPGEDPPEPQHVNGFEATEPEPDKKKVKTHKQRRRGKKGAKPIQAGSDPLSLFHAEGQNDTANSRRLVKVHGDNIRFSHLEKCWYVFDGKRWKRDTTGAVVLLAKDIVDRMFSAALAIDDTDTLMFCARSAGARGISNMLALAQSEPGIPIQPDDFDKDPMVLNVQNGTIDLKTGRLKPHCRGDMLSKICPLEYDPGAACHEFEKCLDKIFDGKQPLIDFLRRLIGYCITGKTTEQILPILFGGGSNGKSLLLKLFMQAIGTDFAMTANRELLIKQKGERHPTELAQLRGMRLVVAIETDDGHQLAEGLVKQLTGGERVRGRGMKENFYEFDASHKILLCTNYKPEIKGEDHAIWRRIALLPFVVRFWNADAGESGDPELQADKGLADQLQSELPGVLAWAVRGCLEWQSSGLKIPSEVQEATSEYRNAEDVLAAFLAEMCLVMPGVRVRASQLYQVFHKWCKDAGESVRTQRQFGKAMTSRNFDRLANNGIWYVGVVLNAQAEQAATEPTEP